LPRAMTKAFRMVDGTLDSLMEIQVFQGALEEM
jgi:hypothetical protein